MAELKKVHPGGRLKRIPVSTYNAFIDAARSHKESLRTGNRSLGGNDPGIVIVHNNTEMDQNRFAVLGIDGARFLPDILEPSDERAFLQAPIVVEGSIPTEAHRGHFVVLLAPVQKNGYTPGQISDLVKVRLIGPQDDWADVLSGSTALQTQSSGSARVVWQEQIDGERWGTVRLAGVSEAPAGFSRGKVVDVDPVGQFALVRLVSNPEMNPSNAKEWLNDDNFDPRFICCWTMGKTLARARNPCVVFGGNGVPWMMPHLNLVGTNYNESCPPTGILSPDLDQQCEPPAPETKLFDQPFACNLPDGTCGELPLCLCLLSGGQPIPDPEGGWMPTCPEG